MQNVAAAASIIQSDQPARSYRTYLSPAIPVLPVVLGQVSLLIDVAPSVVIRRVDPIVLLQDVETMLEICSGPLTVVYQVLINVFVGIQLVLIGLVSPFCSFRTAGVAHASCTWYLSGLFRTVATDATGGAWATSRASERLG